MNTRSRILPKLTVSTASGSDPDVIEIDDAREAIGECETDDWGDIVTPCPNRPDHGQCEYTARDRHTRCIHCGTPSELDR